MSVSNIANPIPSSLCELLTHLQYIAMTKKDQKPCIRKMNFVDSNSTMGAIYRFFTSENHDSLVMYIEKIINQTVAALNEYQKTEFLSIIMESLSEAKNGIENIITTYEKYPQTVSRLTVCLKNIKLQLDRNSIGTTSNTHLSSPIATASQPNNSFAIASQTSAQPIDAQRSIQQQVQSSNTQEKRK